MFLERLAWPGESVRFFALKAKFQDSSRSVIIINLGF